VPSLRRMPLSFSIHMSKVMTGRVITQSHRDKIGAANSIALKGVLAPDRVARLALRVRGEGNPAAKLNENQVREIKIALRDRIKREILAQRYNVSVATIKAIRSGKLWKHVVI